SRAGTAPSRPSESTGARRAGRRPACGTSRPPRAYATSRRAARCAGRSGRTPPARARGRSPPTRRADPRPVAADETRDDAAKASPRTWPQYYRSPRLLHLFLELLELGREAVADAVPGLD